MDVDWWLISTVMGGTVGFVVVIWREVFGRHSERLDELEARIGELELEADDARGTRDLYR